MSEWKGKTALITGASYGIGEAFARELASSGANLILTARSLDRLEALANELRARNQINVSVIAADLADPAGPQKIFSETEAQGLRVDLLINNAGFGRVGDFAYLPLQMQLDMIQVNLTSLVALTHHYLGGMLERRSGAIIQVASTASFQGVPYFAVYGATKSFILNFSEALWGECRDAGVRVLALCPGPTATHFQATAGTSHRLSADRMQTAEEVVRAGLEALAAGRSHVVSGLSNRVMVGAERFLPRTLVTRVAARLFRPFSTAPQN